MADTKECPNCDAKIASSEVKCPACGVNIEELEDAVTTVETAQKVIEKRRAKNAPAAPPEQQPEKKSSKLLSLGSALRKRG